MGLPLKDQSNVEDVFEARVRESARITPEESKEEVRHIVLDVEKTDFRAEVGQNISVVVPGPHEFGNYNHCRLYSIASVPGGEEGFPSSFSICVRRCFYVDEVNGEEYPGIASNHLCDRRPGDTVQVMGPHPSPFSVPDDKTANLLMFGLGTGIAPFRAFIKHIYDSVGGWEGKVRLFYGAKSGLELLYMNDERNDLAQYYDQETFRAFEAVSPRPHMDDPVALGRRVEENAEEIRAMLDDPNTYAYVAGLEIIRELLDEGLVKVAGPKDAWARKKAEMTNDGRWTELTY